jgi:NADH-quinone oxidoreductase subunit C
MKPVLEKGTDDLSGIRAWRCFVGGYADTGVEIDMSLEVQDLPDAAGILLERGYFLEDIAGVDVREGILLVYHFDRYEASRRVVLRVVVSHDAPVVPTLTGIFSGADWHERECFDFFGVVFDGHPNLKPLLLPDDLQQHPLIKESNRQSLFTLFSLDRNVDNEKRPRADGETARIARSPE